MRANCELSLAMERQIIISGIGLGLRFFYHMNFFKQPLSLGSRRRINPSCRPGGDGFACKTRVYATDSASSHQLAICTHFP